MRHFQPGTGLSLGLKILPWDDRQAPCIGHNHEKLKDAYEANTPFNFERDQEGSIYSLPLSKAFTIPQLMIKAQEIYERK